MKFSELLGDPEPERDLPEPEGEPISVFAPVPTVPPAADSAPPAPDATAPTVPTAPPVRHVPPPPPAAPEVTFRPPAAPSAPERPAPLPRPVAGQVPSSGSSAQPVGGRSGLAEVNVRQEPAAPEVSDPDDAVEHLDGLAEVVDDLLPSARRKARK